jgi:hypothetical protein
MFFVRMLSVFKKTKKILLHASVVIMIEGVVPLQRHWFPIPKLPFVPHFLVRLGILQILNQ